MADVNATDLTEEILSTLSGNEQFVMFDPIEGKRAALSVIANYIAEHGEINGDDIPTIITAIQDELSNVKEDLQDKADQNGVYPDLSAGNITGDFHIDTKPYLYRALREVASHIGGKAFDTLVGGSVAVNQLVTTGTTSVTIPSGHKYYSNINNVKTIGASTGAAIAINDDTKDNVIDLTQLFASDPSIADRAYTLEQGTAGSGIAWLKSYGYIRDGYIPYNQGTLQSVLTTGKKVVGLNQWDEEWELGEISASTGVDDDTSTSQWRSQNYIPILPNTSYYAVSKTAGTKSIRARYYDADKNYIGYSPQGGGQTFTNTVFLTPTNAYYIRFAPNISDIPNHDICINLSKTTGTPKNGDYLPYESVTYQISPEELRGTLKLVNNEIQYNGDVRYADGTLTRKFAQITFDGSSDEDWYSGASADTQYFRINIGAYGSVVAGSIVSNIYPETTINSTNTVIGIFVTNSGAYNDAGIMVRPANANGMTIAQFKALLAANPVTAYYELATPTTETVDSFTSPQQVFTEGTEEYLDTRTVPIPVGHETKYELDLAEKLRDLPWDMSMIAPVEVEYKATRNYTAGQLFIVDNILYKATANIANGGTITPNTNCSATTLAEVISTL